MTLHCSDTKLRRNYTLEVELLCGHQLSGKNNTVASLQLNK